MREKIKFDKNWYFHRGDINLKESEYKGYSYVTAKTERMHKGPASQYFNSTPDCFDDDKELETDRWELVDLPHDYVIKGIPDEKYNNALGFFKYDNAWYVKKFYLNDEDKEKRISLYFEGIATNAIVYLNGCLLKHSFTGYTPFEVNITDMVKFGRENVLSIYVNTENHEGWWYEGGGIYRHVWMIKTEPVCIDLDGVFANPKLIEEEKWNVETDTTVLNDSLENVEVLIEGKIVDKNNNIVSTQKVKDSIFVKDKKIIKYNFCVNNPFLWSPDDCNMYKMVTSLFINGQKKDEYSVNFGFRSFYVDKNKGLFINGKNYKIKGFCGHADCGLMGKAVPDNIHRYKVSLMKEMGANGYRTSHYPQSDVVMDELDKQGFIVMDEIRWYESTEEGLEQLETLVKRDRNHPSVFFWTLGNEEPYHGKPQGERIFCTLAEKLKKLDNSRLITAAVDRPLESTVYKYCDVIGINYNLDAYDTIRKKFPDKTIMATECVASGTTRGWYYDEDKTRGYIPAVDRNTQSYFAGREATWKFLFSKEWILGGYQWIAFEHRGEAVWPRLCSQSGSIDLFLQKKDVFYQNQSFFSDKPMIHLLPHWNWNGFENEKIKVTVYSNIEEIELTLNDEIIDRKNIGKIGHAEFDVNYIPGKIKANGYINGKLVASDERITTGRPYKLKLIQDTDNVHSNGEDIAVISCIVVDENDNEIYDAENIMVEFITKGDCSVYSTGSDISDHSSLFLPYRKMRAGRISVAVKLGMDCDNMNLVAKANGLVSAMLKIKVSE